MFDLGRLDCLVPRRCGAASFDDGAAGQILKRCPSGQLAGFLDVGGQVLTLGFLEDCGGEFLRFLLGVLLRFLGFL